MNFWIILKNIGLVISFFKTLKDVSIKAAEQKKIPKCDETQILLHKLEELFEKKVIDLPGEKEAEIAEILKQVREQFQCPLE